MRYYKIIRDGFVIGAGCTFLRWYPSKRRFFYCDIDDAERVQDALTEKLYHDDWLKDAPSGADAADEAEVVMINSVEYDEIIEELSGGGEIPVPDPESEPTPGPEPEPAPNERPMTVQEMREKIAEMEEALNIIMGVVE